MKFGIDFNFKLKNMFFVIVSYKYLFGDVGGKDVV